MACTRGVCAIWRRPDHDQLSQQVLRYAFVMNIRQWNGFKDVDFGLVEYSRRFQNISFHWTSWIKCLH